MPTSSNQAKSLRDKALSAMKSDPKKTGVLTLLVIVLAVMWVRMWSGSKGGPAPAVAATQAPAFLVGNGEASSHKSGEVLAALTAWKSSEIPVGLGRNLFAAKLDYFPSDAKSVQATTPVATETSTTFWNQVEKSMSDQADLLRQRQVRSENLQRQVASLRLESTLMGQRPKAVIGGELVGVGGVVASGSGEDRTEFRVVKIEARRVIVEREGIELEIPMK